MSVTDFEYLEQQFLELIGEFRSVTSSERRIREALRTETTRADAAEARCAAAERVASDAQDRAAAATAAVTQATTALAQAQDQITGLKIQLELAQKQRTLLEERIAEMVKERNSLEREVQQLRPLQSAQASLQRQYTELQDRVMKATEEARRESSRLEAELRRVEKCAAGGTEIRERARLAAAAHAGERRLSAAELQHANRELQHANLEITKLRLTVAELQLRLSSLNHTSSQKDVNPDMETLAEVRAVLEAEMAGSAKIEKALAAALADNAKLAALLHTVDKSDAPSDAPTSPETTSVNFPIDSFLAE